jgi:hypothetical protein
MTGVISLRVAAPRKLNDYSLEIIMGQTEIVSICTSQTGMIGCTKRTKACKIRTLRGTEID